MRRGDLITVAGGPYGKPRRAVVLQADAAADMRTVIICQLTSTLLDAPAYRIEVSPDAMNNLRQPSQVMADKITFVLRERCGPVFGRLSEAVMSEVSRSLAVLLALNGNDFNA